MAGYCSSADVYSYGLPRGAVPNPARLIESAIAGSELFTLDVHGFETNDAITLRAEAGGNLPAPLVEGTTYYVRKVTDSAFSVALTAGGAAVNLTTDGENVLVVQPVPFDAAISWGARVIDDMLPAHVVPLESPYPEIIVMTNAELAGWKLASVQGAASKPLSDIVDGAQKRIARWATGVPVRGTNTQPRSGLSTSAAAPTSDPIGWDRWGGI